METTYRVRINRPGFAVKSEEISGIISSTAYLDSPKLHRFQGLVGLTKTGVEKKRQRTHLSRMVTPYPSKDNCSTGATRSTARKSKHERVSVARGTAINGRLDWYHSPSPW